MESQLIFDNCWRRFEERYGAAFHCPREIVWLNGAPGSGKGVNTAHILKIRGLARAVTISSLLASNTDSRKLIDAGEMVTDSLVGDVLLASILGDAEPTEFGLVVDGFPRTSLQVDFLKLLHDKLEALHDAHADDEGPDGCARFPRPSFKVVMLYVDEETSISRQLRRAKIASLHNRRARDAGAGLFKPERPTDVSVETAHKRYEIFKAHYSAILRLKQFFPFHLIDSMGSLTETQEQITQELRYQSSLDLSEETYAMIRHLPLSKELVRTARQQLVSRLDTYAELHRPDFAAVLGLLDSEVVPLLRHMGLSGHAQYSSQSPLFAEAPMAVSMLIDTLSDRGFSASYAPVRSVLPERVDLKTGEVRCREVVSHVFRITWDTRNVRDQIKTMEIAARVAEAATGTDTRISQSFIPEHIQEAEAAPR